MPEPPRGSLAGSLPDLEFSVLELADRLLDRGAVVAGEATISVAGVDLIYLGLNVVLTGVEKLRRGPAEPGAATAGGPGAAPRPSPERPTLPERAEAVPVGEVPRLPEVSVEEAAEKIAGILPDRIDVDPDGVEQGLAKLVLALVEMLRQLLERQAVRRMEGGSLTDEEVERVGLALMRLEEKVRELARHFGLEPSDLNLDLGPLGRLT